MRQRRRFIAVVYVSKTFRGSSRPLERWERIDETRLSCTSVINSEKVTSEIKIIMRVPDRRIAWQAVSDHFRVGVVFLDPLDDGTTRVTVKVRSIIEPVMLTGALRCYLNNFKRFVEEKATT